MKREIRRGSEEGGGGYRAIDDALAAGAGAVNCTCRIACNACVGARTKESTFRDGVAKFEGEGEEEG